MAQLDSDWQLDPNWPGLVAERDAVTYSGDTLRKIAADLEEAMSELTGFSPNGTRSTSAAPHGSLIDLQIHTDLSMFIKELVQVENWPGGRAFAEALKAGHIEILDVYAQVNGKLEVALKLILEGAGTYTVTNMVNES
ncbi:hypothetical protein [Nonomuraea sp. GTA35]|uniref:hypothetical protein n=1 Tax=Nonomuraea sp. GTA35 TaxID=1676746 RepID=UPI0035C1C4EB